MQEGSREVLQRLLYHTHQDNFNSFLKYFDERQRMQIAALPKVEAPIALHLDSLESSLHQFHYSWYVEAFEKCPQPFYSHMLGVFSDEQRAKLQKILKVNTVHKKHSPLINKFLVQWFLKQLGIQQLPPSFFFSHCPNFFLLKIHKKSLVTILHKLGILDIANMAKKIVDKKTIQELLRFFSNDQKKFFNEAQKMYNEPLPASIKDLDKRLEDDQSFTHFLEKRGILRLAMALANENSFLVWYLAHILDQGRGKEFLSVVRRCVPSPYTLYYNKQLLKLCEHYTGSDHTL